MRRASRLLAPLSLLPAANCNHTLAPWTSPTASDPSTADATRSSSNNQGSFLQIPGGMDSTRESSAASSTATAFNEDAILTQIITSDAAARCQGIQDLLVREKQRQRYSYGSSSDAAQFYSTEISRARENKSKNRYRDICPYDRTCVFVGSNAKSKSKETQHEVSQHGLYLNGNWVQDLNHRWWIASQAPLQTTLGDFFALSTSLQPSEQRVRTIVQLTSCVENRMVKADPYIPESTEETVLYTTSIASGPDSSHLSQRQIEVQLISSECHHSTHATLATLEIRLLKEPHDRADDDRFESVTRVRHFLFESWPDFGVPAESDMSAVIELVNLVSEHPDTSRTGVEREGPVLVHCSAGVGRTGTFIAISSLIAQLRAARKSTASGDAASPVSPSRIDPSSIVRDYGRASPLSPAPASISSNPIYAEIDNMREYRMGMVQKPEQIGFVFSAMRFMLAKRESER